MATEFKPQVPSIYATDILCVVSLYSASKTNFDWNSNRHQQESYMQHSGCPLNEELVLEHVTRKSKHTAKAAYDT